MTVHSKCFLPAIAGAAGALLLANIALTANAADSTAASSELADPTVAQPTTVQGLTNQRVCPAEPAPRVVEIREADPEGDKAHHDAMRQQLHDSVAIANTTVLLGPNVVLDFSDASDQEAEIIFGPCVTLASINAFRSVPLPPGASWQAARSAGSLGPLIKFGPHRDGTFPFFAINCIAGGQLSDNVRIFGFRLYGPSFGQQDVDDEGIRVFRCLNVEIFNMEIAGWGGKAINIVDEGDADGQPADGPGQQQPNNLPGERIGQASQVRVFRNYIHHNQHPTQDGHAAGYGVDVGHGAWAQVFENVFDFNRHAIAASGDTGGYLAARNLVLKGGGVHDGIFNHFTHQFDIHGTGDNGFGGRAGVTFEFSQNAFQYRSDNAIKVRGRPQKRVHIHDNIFPHEGLEDDSGDDAIAVNDDQDIADGRILLGPNNTINQDSYGDYGVCDFDGDGVDDMFLATGQTWWFSSFGELQWTYLSARTERLNQVRLGYFDADQRCDVLTEDSHGEWVIASAGVGPWRSLGAFGAPLAEVSFGRFDPAIRDHRPGVTRQTTHAFWRTASGQWLVSPLTAPAWHEAASSSFPLGELRFGDFTGDGVTDVLAVQNGHWSISDAAHGSWQTLNANLADDVSSLYIADLNHNNIDDLIKLERIAVALPGGGPVSETLTWWVSDDGRGPWRKLKSYDGSPFAPRLLGFAGRFGTAPGGGVLLIDHNRIGRFFSEAQIAAGTPPDWSSLFAY